MKMNSNYQQVISSDDIVEVWLRNNNVNTVVSTDTDLVNEYNNWSNYFDTPAKINIEKPSSESAEQFVERCTSNWYLPDKYKQLDIEHYLLDKCSTQEEVDRVATELHLYKERNMYPVLRFLVYFTDTLRDKNIVWGVGRGSSVASFCLFLIGVHKINPLLYNLDITEFLR